VPASCSRLQPLLLQGPRLAGAANCSLMLPWA
jgi:hypothetical protein